MSATDQPQSASRALAQLTAAGATIDQAVSQALEAWAELVSQNPI